MSYPIEQWLFGGDVRNWLVNVMHISYDQRNAIVVGFAMGFAVMPTIFSIAEDAVFDVPKHLTYGSLALGATPWQTMIRVVLLTASPGIFSAVMIGMGRAVGETMIVLMATGNTPVVDFSLFQGMRTLAANIARGNARIGGGRHPFPRIDSGGAGSLRLHLFVQHHCRAGSSPPAAEIQLLVGHYAIYRMV